jgi:hypothetical protein
LNAGSSRIGSKSESSFLRTRDGQAAQHADVAGVKLTVGGDEQAESVPRQEAG